jgi:hypothetical protein
MECDGCGERMQRQTVVLVTRKRIGKSREIRPGWYCWTCRANAPDCAAKPDTTASASTPPRRPGWTGFGAWRGSTPAGRAPEIRP